MLLSVILGVLFSGYIVNKKISNLDIPEKQEQLQEIKANMDNIEVNVDNKFTTMYVSYAKDLVVSGKTVDEAIEIIKKTRDAFS